MSMSSFAASKSADHYFYISSFYPEYDKTTGEKQSFKDYIVKNIEEIQKNAEIVYKVNHLSSNPRTIDLRTIDQTAGSSESSNKALNEAIKLANSYSSYIEFYLQDSADIFKELLEGNKSYILVVDYWNPGYRELNLSWSAIDSSILYAVDLETREVFELGEIITPERNKRIFESFPTNQLGKLLGKKLHEAFNE